MERIIYYSDYKVKETNYVKQEIIYSLILKSISFLIGIFALGISIFKGSLMLLTYFGVFTLCLSLIINIIFIILDLIRLFTKKDYRNKVLYTLKYMITSSLFLAFFINLIFITPYSILNNEINPFIKFGALFSSIILPILSFIDFIEFDYNYKTKRSYVYFSFIIFIIYLITIFSLSKALNLTWLNYIDNSEISMPYFNLDYNLNSLSNLSYTIFFYILILFLGGMLLLHFKNKKYIKVYKIPYTSINVHQDI